MIALALRSVSLQRLSATPINRIFMSADPINRISPRMFLVNTARLNTTLARKYEAQRRQVGKKESGEFLKWLLMMIPATTFGLGCWQVYRLQWKLNLIDIMQAKSNADPVEMPDNLSDLEKMEYMPVKVRGKFLHNQEILIGPRSLIDNDSLGARFGSLVSDPKTNQGWLVITPFKMTNGNIILINRGWIPQNMKSSDKRQSSYIEGETELTGVVRLTEKRAPFMPKNHPEKNSWFYRDLEQLSSFFGCDPVWLDARGISDPPDGWPIPNQTRVTLRNEHLSYIVTWYLLSAFTGHMWYRYFVKKLPLL